LAGRLRAERCQQSEARHHQERHENAMAESSRVTSPDAVCAACTLALRRVPVHGAFCPKADNATEINASGRTHHNEDQGSQDAFRPVSSGAMSEGSAPGATTCNTTLSSVGSLSSEIRCSPTVISNRKSLTSVSVGWTIARRMEPMVSYGCKSHCKLTEDI
jgi:hypothetical protein